MRHVKVRYKREEVAPRGARRTGVYDRESRLLRRAQVAGSPAVLWPFHRTLRPVTL